MGLLDSIFGGSKSDSPTVLEAFSGQSELLKNLATASNPKGLEAIGLAGQPFEQLLASLSQYQQQGLSGLGDVLNRPLATQSPLFQQGQQAISGALEGFDPFKDLRFKALQTNLSRELAKAKDRIAARSSSKDTFFGGGRIDQEREVEEASLGQMATLAGTLEAESRRNQLAAVPMAQQYAALADEEPRSRLQDMLFGLGAAPRQFEQESITAKNTEQQRILQELTNIGLNPSMQTSMFKPDFYVPSYGPSQFSELAGLFGSIGSLGTLGGLGSLAGLFA